MRTRVLLAALVLLVTGCGAESSPRQPPQGEPTPAAPVTSSATPPTPSATSTPRPTSPTTASHPSTPITPSAEVADPRWRFFTSDRTRWASPWFAGRHRVMIDYGCTPAPYYEHDPRCPGRQGFHHGIDVAMPCGTLLRSAVTGTVLSPTAPGAPGAAYGVHPFRIRTGAYDVLVGHARTVYVAPGQRVRPGQRIALAADSGAPDGCHLHFEVRRAGGGLAAAVDPSALLRLGR